MTKLNIEVKFDTELQEYAPFVNGQRMTVFGDRDDVKEALKNEKLVNAIFAKVEDTENNFGLLYHMVGCSASRQESCKETFLAFYDVYVF